MSAGSQQVTLPIIQDITMELEVVGGSGAAEKGKLLITRIEAKNKVNGFSEITLYMRSQSSVTETLNFKDINQKLFKIKAKIQRPPMDVYEDVILAGYPRSFTNLSVPKKQAVKMYQNFYKVELVSKFWWLTQDMNCRVFSNKSNPEKGVSIQKTLEELLQDTGLSSSEDYNLSGIKEPASKSVLHHCFIQYNTCTMDFIENLEDAAGIFSFDGLNNGKPCRYFMDTTEDYKIYDKYKGSCLYYSQILDGTPERDVILNYENSFYDTYMQKIYQAPYYKKWMGYFLIEQQQTTFVPEVTWFQYNPDDFTKPSKDSSGKQGKGFNPQYFVYTQGVDNGECSNKAKAWLNRLESDQFLQFATTYPVTQVGKMIQLDKNTQYIKDYNLAEKYLVIESEFVYGFPVDQASLSTNFLDRFNVKDTRQVPQYIWDEKFIEYNCLITCIPANKYPPPIEDLKPNNAVGKYLDAVVTSKSGNSKGTGVDTNAAGDVYVGLYLEYKAAKGGYEDFTPVRVKMNITNGLTVPMMNTPATVMQQEFGQMLVYSGQRHDNTNKPVYPPDNNSYWMRHDTKPPGVTEREVVFIDHKKYDVTTLAKNNIVETAQNDIKETAVKDIVYLAKQNMNITVNKNMTTTVDENKTTSVTKNMTTTVNGNKSTTVSQNMTTTVTQNWTASITGNMVTSVTGSKSSEVTGATSAISTGPYSITTEAAMAVTAEGAIAMTAEAAVSITAAAAISLTGAAGGTFQGATWTVNAPEATFQALVNVGALILTEAITVKG